MLPYPGRTKRRGKGKEEKLNEAGKPRKQVNHDQIYLQITEEEDHETGKRKEEGGGGRGGIRGRGKEGGGGAVRRKGEGREKAGGREKVKNRNEKLRKGGGKKMVEGRLGATAGTIGREKGRSLNQRGN